MKITPLEAAFLTYLSADEYMAGDLSVPTWADECCERASLAEGSKWLKSGPGLIGSLVKKGLLYTQENADGDLLGFTAAGIAVVERQQAGNFDDSYSPGGRL